MIEQYKKLKDMWWRSIERVHPSLHVFLFRYRMYVKYIFSGGTAAVTNLVSLSFFVEVLKMHYLPSSALAFALGFLVSFILQKFFTFGDFALRLVHRQAVVYFIIALINVALNTALMYLFVDVAGLWYLFAQIFAGALIAFESFFLYRRFVFQNASY